MKESSAPLFTKIDISKKTTKNIHFLQASFERFCENMSRKCPNNDERQQAIYRMQEACVWFCRSIAKKDFKTTETVHDEIITPTIIEPTPEEIAEQERDAAAWIKANSIEVPEIKPIIIVKKRTFHQR